MRKSVIHASRFQRPTIVLAVASALALLSSGAALAQTDAASGAASKNTSKDASGSEAQRAPDDQNVGTTVMVVGTRKSVASAIDRKIRNSTVSDSLVAEDINQFPDKNVGEALSRITGVQLTRDFGEGTQVSIRGVEPNLNRVEVNGMSVLSTNGTAGRGAELRELASELISSIDVYKGSTADLTEGGVGGSVIIRTRKPLDFKKFTFATTLAGEQASSVGGVQPRASVLIADRFFDNRLGLMANIVYDNVLTRNDYSRNTSWRFLRDWDFSPDKTVTSIDPALAAITSPGGCSASSLSAAQKTACQQQWYDYSPGISRYGTWTRDHDRASAELTAQYKFSNDLTAFVSYQGNRQHEELNDRNFGTDFGAVTRLANTGAAPIYNMATGVPTTPGTCIAAPTASTPDGMVVNNHYVTQYTVGSCNYLAGQGGQGAFSTSARDYILRVSSNYTSAGFNYKHEALEVEGLVGTSRSDYHSDSNNIVLTQNAPGLKVTLDAQGLPHFDFPAGYSSDASSSYVQAQLQYRPTATKNSEDQAKIDFKYRLATPFFSKVWFGAQGTKSTSQQYNGGGYLASNGSDLVSPADDVNVVTANVNQTLIYDPYYTGTAQRAPEAQSYLNANYSTKYINAAQMAALIDAVRGRTPGTFFQGYDKISNIPSGWMSPVYSNATQFFDTSHFNFGNVYQALGSDGKMYPQIPVFQVEERTKAGYLRLDFDTEVAEHQIWGNIGVRYTGTRDKASGLYKFSVRQANTPGGSTYTDRVVTNSIVSWENQYHDYLPSLNVMGWVIPDKFMIRTGLSKVMSRPSIDLLTPAATCTLNSGLAQFGGDGQDDCTAGNPKLKPFRATNTDLSFEYYPSQDSQYSIGLFKKEISSYILEKQLVRNVDLFGTGQLFDVTQPINGKGATTKGIELTARTAFTFLPGWLSGFGIDTNYTRMTYKYAPGTERINPLDGTVLPYAGLSRNSYNAALWYDLGKINARVAYNYRDRFYTGTNDVSGNPNFQEKTGFLDAKIQYRYNDHITISLEGKNLTDQAQITDAGDLFRVNELAFSGRRYFVSLSYKN
ncbi:TonB-dependent receptor [Duganella callida]|uniref:TonB-dependent receptor n=1 Tax=Duganella callida TaxID=2561932 RepID=A0A4Y9SLR6_9BURK|nr:TonB-dependent receptor [Duganella callida]TFW27622.1 TonB-dependent receptor [Duganella callida]